MQSSQQHRRKRNFTAFAAALLIAACGGGGGGDDGVPPPDINPGADTHRVSGTVQVAGGVAVDGDVNDPQAPYTANDSLAQAQPLSNPATVGGYVNVAGSGADGRSRTRGDRAEFYRVSLAAGQGITLSIADAGAADLDLFLFDANGVPAQSAQGTAATEALRVDAAGEYRVQVYAAAGASNYVLIVGQAQTLDAAGLNRASLDRADEWVPDEAIVRLRETGSGMLALAATAGLAPAGGAPDRAMLWRMPQSDGAALRTLGAPDTDPAQMQLLAGADAELMARQRTIALVKALRARPEVAYAEPNYLRRLQAVPNDPRLPLQWHYPLINLPQAWDIATGSAQVIVAVIDNGFLLDHPDLRERFLPGYDFISDSLNAADGNFGRDDDPADPGDPIFQGGSFHGTHVAGTIGAAGNNGAGVSGVNWDLRLLPLRAAGLLGAASFDVIEALRYAAGLPNVSGRVPARRADIVNLSLGGSSFSQAEQDAFIAARAAGVIVVAAAGNLGTTQPFYPAAYSGVVSVGAVRLDRSAAPYSSFGATVDLVAPGGDMTQDLDGDGFTDGVLSTTGAGIGPLIEPRYGFLQGTSMASPHVAGVAALMKAVSPGLTPDQFDSLLNAGGLTADLGAPGYDTRFGHGLIDAHQAVVAAGGPIAVVPALAATPQSLNLPPEQTSAVLGVRNAGGGPLAVTSVTDDMPWLAVSASGVDAKGLGNYLVSVDRTGLAPGSYRAAITFVSTANPLTVPVIAQVGSASAGGSVGLQYLVLIEPGTDEAAAQQAVTPAAGRYAYAVDARTGRSYQIFAGTDYDNDGFICDAGEACGAYPSLDQPLPVEVQDDRGGLGFASGFAVNLSAQTAESGSGSGAPSGLRRAPPEGKRLGR